jgi:hypothetical protein
LSIFFLAGAVAAFTSVVALLFPGGPLDPLWRANPRALEHFRVMGSWAVVLMAVVGAACALCGIGLLRRARWGHRLAAGILAVNLVGNLVNSVLGVEPRAIVGVPIAGGLIAYLMSPRVRQYFVAGT